MPLEVWRNEELWMRAMELKVWVDGVQRVVCGVTELTTCQEVVVALAQAIGNFNTYCRKMPDMLSTHLKTFIIFIDLLLYILQI